MNRGLVSRLALARIDLKRLALSAETFTNWMPRVIGSMMLRPGLQYIGGTYGNLKTKYLDFVFATDDTALVELTTGIMRVLVDDVVITRPAVTSTFFRWNSGGSTWDTSSDTTSPLTSADVGYWKDNDEAGATSAHATGDYLSLIGTGRMLAIRDRKVDVSVASTNVEHSINIVVARGNVTLRIGSSEGGEQYLTDRTLRPGYHSISVTPTADFFIRLSNYATVAALVDSVTIQQAAADMTLVTPWLQADLDNVRWAQSGDVIFVACDGYIQKRIERQGATSPRSWSVVDYLADDGPFGDLNVGPVRLKGSATTGEITLTAERAFFKSTHVGALFELNSSGQEVTVNILAEDTWSEPIRVTGVGAAARGFIVEITSATFTGTTTVRIQRSVATVGDWSDVSGWTWTADTPPGSLNDGLDNQIIYYRIGVKTGEFTALDDIDASLTYSSGSIAGRVRVNEFTSTTAVSASVLATLGKADQYTADWREGDWSPRKGYPSAVELDNGRLFWSGKSMTWGSVSDQFDSFDDETEGDSGPIRRTIGKGPVDTVNWLIGGENLLMGMQGSVQAVRSSALDEPITQAKYRTVPVSSIGTAAVPAALVDNSVVFVGRNTERAYETAIEGGTASYGPPADLTAIVPELGSPGFTKLAVQRSPDTRLHFLRSDGKVAVLVREKLENVACWLLVETDGEVVDIIVLPGLPATPAEDRVYYVVKRTIDGATVRYLEKWALESQARGAADNRIADSFVAGTLTNQTTISDLDHLEGATVCLWGNGKDLGTYVVSGGSITSSERITGPYTVGLPYTGQWKSAKLMGAGEQVPFGKAKRISKLTLVAADMHAQGLQYGQSFDELDDLPLVEKGATVDPDSIWTDYAYDAFTLNGVYEEDARLCLQATAPRPATVLAVAIE